jgi:hypothetical protein
MGASFTNYQIRSTSVAAVKKALEPLIKSRAYISPEKNGWITVYDETSDERSEALTRIGPALSKSLETAVFAFLVYDSDVAMYWLYQNGTLEDEFNSAPDYFEEDVDENSRDRVRGNADRLQPLCIPDTTREQIEEVIHPADGLPLMAEDIFGYLARLLGIDDARISLGFTYFEDEAEEILSDAREYEPVGKKSARKKNPSPEKLNQPAPPRPEMFPLAIGMLTQCWSGKYEQAMDSFRPILAFTGTKPAQMDGMVDVFREECDRGARDLLKLSKLPGRPTIEELKAARDKGPEALAQLLTARTPTMLADIASNAVREGLEKFVAALLAEGLDPNSKDHDGDTLITAAEKLGVNSRIYLMMKSAREKKP